MKYMNRIRLLAVLLCAVLLLAACSSGEDVPPTDDQQTEDTAPGTDNNGDAPSAPAPIEPVLKNFFTFTNVKPWKILKTASRLEGEVKEPITKAVILRDAKVDVMNQATETFTVFNTEKGEAVLTLTNTYSYRADYANFDWNMLDWIDPCFQDPDVIYPERVLDVQTISYGDYTVIEARRATITPINRDTDEEDVDLYDVQTVYEYYDLSGAKLAESARAADVHSMSMTRSGATLTIAGANVTFDSETGLAISVTAADGTVTKLAYDMENETYGYYLDQVQYSAQGASRHFFEVYNKADSTCVLRYYLEDCDRFVAYPLQNGNILVQYLNLVEEGMDYDVNLMGSFSTLETFLVEVPTGKTTEISLDYVLMELASREDILDLAGLDSFGIYLTENVVNFGVVVPISEQKTADMMDMTIVVLDNDGSVMFELAPIIPEQQMGFGSMNPFGFSMLPSGDYLVNLVEQVTDADRAIVTQDGRVRAYLTSNASIVGEYVILSDGIYDYDLKKVYDFEENNVKFETIVGERILVSMVPDPDDDPVNGTVYHELYKEEGLFLTREAFGGENVSFDSSWIDYVIVFDEDTDKYVLYNVNLEHVLTTQNSMNVMACGDRYLVETTIYADGIHRVFYTIGE